MIPAYILSKSGELLRLRDKLIMEEIVLEKEIQYLMDHSPFTWNCHDCSVPVAGWKSEFSIVGFASTWLLWWEERLMYRDACIGFYVVFITKHSDRTLTTCLWKFMSQYTCNSFFHQSYVYKTCVILQKLWFFTTTNMSVIGALQNSFVLKMAWSPISRV